MREAGLEAIAGAEAMGVTGLIEWISSFPAIAGAYRGARRALESRSARPDLVILIDYPDFNLRLAAHARRAGIPVLYFVSPQVWAWRRGRVKQIARLVDRMLVILPFEEAIYREASVPVEFVGHPLLDIVHAGETRARTLRPLGLDARTPTVALLPGSRRNELNEHLPPMLGAAVLLAREFKDVQFLIPVAPTLPADQVERTCRELLSRSGDRPDRGGIRWALVRERRYDAVAASDVAAVASGTATLETALLGVPMVIVYKMNRLTHLLARLVSDLPHIGMPNLIAGERVVPELVQGECRPDRIAIELRRILTDPGIAAGIRRGLEAVRSKLGQPGAIGRAAASAWDMMSHSAPARERRMANPCA
jgi:lipid-A-disaccharide synthase